MLGVADGAVVRFVSEVLGVCSCGMTNSETFPAFGGLFGTPVRIRRMTPLDSLRLLFETYTPALCSWQSLLGRGLVMAWTLLMSELVRGLDRYTALN